MRSYLDTDIGKNDIEDHLINRLRNFRYKTIPWMNSLISLKQSKVLEIGCGTGCTTVALAEQGCELTSIDVDEIHIKVAKKRCELYGLPVNISSMNATEIHEINKKFDIIVFSASLEHFELALNIRCSDLDTYNMQSFTGSFISNAVLNESKYNTLNSIKQHTANFIAEFLQAGSVADRNRRRVWAEFGKTS